MSDRDILRPLVDLIVALASRPEEEDKKELWARFNALQPVDKIPVCMSFEGIPDCQWDLMFGRNHLQCTMDTARTIEFYLKKRIWMAGHVPDDHVVWAAIPVPAVHTRDHHQWGVELAWRKTDDELGSEAIIAPFAEEIDLSRLRRPLTQIDDVATAALLEEAEGLVDGLLMVYPEYKALGESPFEFAVRMRGMERIFFDVYDYPALVHAMMDFITKAIIADHTHREAHGWINCPADASGRYQMVLTFRQIATRLLPDFANRHPQVKDERAYVSAQSASGLGPAMFAEFVHPYNCRLAELFPPNSVYFHGCECLDQKLDVIATLPNLGRHHVSAWSSVAAAAQKYQGSVVLEVTSHPNLIATGASRDEMFEEMRDRVEQADGCPLTLSITDVQNLDGNPDLLRVWAEAAQDVASLAGGR